MQTVVYLSVDSDDYSSTSRYKLTQALRSNLLVRYDFFYNTVNPTTLMSLGSYQDRIPSVPLDVGSDIQVQTKKQIKLTSLSTSANSGFIVYFEFRSKSVFYANLDLLTVNIGSSFSLIVYYGDLNSLLVRTTNQSGQFLITTLLWYWYQVVVKIDNMNGSYTASAYVRNLLSLESQSFTFSAGLLSNAEIVFGDTSSTTQLLVEQKLITFDLTNNTFKLTIYLFNINYHSNISVYEGSFISETNSCYLQTEGTDKECLICKPGYNLNYQTNRSCVSQASSTKGNISDWSRSACPADMMHNPSDSTCQCRYSMYLSGTTCVSCPSYCRGCTSATACVLQDANRDTSTGKCNSNLFDDGYNCLQRTFSIPSRSNYYFQFQNAWATQSVDLDNATLNLTATDTFFFTMKMNKFTETTAVFPQALIYLRDAGVVDTFTITLEKNSADSSYSICYYQTTQQLKCYLINALTSTWMGLWVSPTEIIMAVMSNGRYQYETQTLPSSLSLSNPTLCAGKCVTQSVSTSEFTLDLGLCPFKYFKGMTNPSDFMDDFLHLMTDKSNPILHYIVYPVSIFPASYDSLITTSSVGNIQFDVPTYSFIDRLKGLRSQSGVSATIGDVAQIQTELSISMSMFINELTDESVFYSYEMDSQAIEYSLIPMHSRETAFIRLTLNDESIETRSCFVTFSESNFISIIPRYAYTQDSNDDIFFQVEIVIEYCRETLQLLQPHSNSNKENKNIAFNDDGNRDIYLNNIRFFNGTDFYFDYTETNPCFLYYDASDMQCIKAKESYSIVNGTAVASTDCSSSTSTSIQVYNKYTQECQESYIDYPECEKINEDDLVTCLQCRDSHADPDMHCQCIDGYYLSSTSGLCEKCHEKCVRCSGSYDYCLECTFENTTLPSCDCQQSGQYQATDYSCQTCSSQCETCVDTADNCLTCSKDRVEAPTCDCNSQYFDLSQSDATMCVEWECGYKCNTCEYSATNCTSCAVNRISTPTCDCDSNYMEIDETCTQCPSHSYFDLSINDCSPCSDSCEECYESATYCIQCDSKLYLYNSECLCSDLTPYMLDAAGEIVCSEGMDVSLKSALINSKNSLVFTFDEVLDSIDFNVYEINTLVYIYFQQIAQTDFGIVSASIDGNKLIIELEFYKTLSLSGGLAIFLKNSVFSNTAALKVLDKKYLVDYLPFSMGPIVISEKQYTPNKSLEEVAAFLTESSGSLIEVIRQLQILFYIINTLQPCSLFLLVNVTPPPNLYLFLQVFGLLVFPQVNSYGIPKAKTSFEFVGEPLETDIDVSANTNSIFAQLGLSGSLLVSMPLAFLQLFLWPFLYVSALVLYQIIGKHRTKYVVTIYQAQGFFLARMAANIESSMLILIALSCNQLFNINQTQFFNRASLYVAILINGVMICLYYKSFRTLNIRKHSHYALTETERAAFNLIEKLDTKNKCAVIYLYSQILKKIFLAVGLVLLSDFPLFACIFCCCVLFISLGLSIYLRPYTRRISNICKIYGEAAQVFVWGCYFIEFIPYTQKLANNSTISEEDTDLFLNIGFACFIALVVFNGLYLIEFFLVKVICKTRDIIKNRKGSKSDNDVYGESNWRIPDGV